MLYFDRPVGPFGWKSAEYTAWAKREILTETAARPQIAVSRLFQKSQAPTRP
jgi:hypothetical protein